MGGPAIGAGTQKWFLQKSTDNLLEPMDQQKQETSVVSLFCFVF
jgi:hypothetical protein